MKISYENYDRLQEELETIPNQSPVWLPSEEELETYVVEKPEKFLEFLLWLTFTVSPVTEEEKANLKAVNRVLYERINFID